MPKWMIPTMVVLSVLALVPFALISRARTSNSPSPRINLIPDMDYQPKYLPQTRNALFVDGRAMRLHPEGTVARGNLAADSHRERGRVNDDWAVSFPMPVTGALMARGQQRYEIYCAPCHGLNGLGAGLVARRADELMELDAAWTPPTSLHDETVRERAVGHLFNTISYGIRTMPAYGSQISTDDRWAIVAYIRALQRSSQATLDDVPRDVRPTLQ